MRTSTIKALQDKEMALEAGIPGAGAGRLVPLHPQLFNPVQATSHTARRRCTRRNYARSPWEQLTFGVREESSMQTTEDGAEKREKELKREDMVWTRIFYGREV